VLQQPADLGFAEFKRCVVEASMRCHWASAVHEAKVERRASGKVEISVFSHDADHAPIVETAVRDALARGAVGELGGVFDEPEHRGEPDERGKTAGDKPATSPATRDEGAPEGPLNEDPSDVMDLGTVLGPRIPPPPPPTWKK
jgi:hypothetical protein